MVVPRAAAGYARQLKNPGGRIPYLVTSRLLGPSRLLGTPEYSCNIGDAKRHLIHYFNKYWWCYISPCTQSSIDPR